MYPHLIIPEPRLWFSSLDEAHFFAWLESIDMMAAVTRVARGRNQDTDLELTFRKRPDEAGIRDLIALTSRYTLDMHCLEVLCTPEHEAWLKDPQKYWYQAIFGHS